MHRPQLYDTNPLTVRPIAASVAASAAAPRFPCFFNANSVRYRPAPTEQRNIHLLHQPTRWQHLLR